MANALVLPGDLVVPGNLRLTGTISPTLDRSSLISISELEPFVVPWTAWRVHDSLDTNLPGTPSGTNLALVGGSFGSASPSIQGADFGGGSYTGYARAQISLPWEYEDGQTVKLRVHAGMLTTVADDYAKLMVECYKSDSEAGVGSELCGEEYSINSLVLADIDYEIASSGLVAGDTLDVRLKVTGNDSGDAGVMIPIIGAVSLLCDVR